MRTIGRLPNIPQRDLIEDVIKKHGYDKISRAFKEGALNNFSNISNLISRIDSNGILRLNKPSETNKIRDGNSMYNSSYSKNPIFNKPPDWDEAYNAENHTRDWDRWGYIPTAEEEHEHGYMRDKDGESLRSKYERSVFEK